jgi:ribosomal-protein-alanine N-acetyltransferase
MTRATTPHRIETARLVLRKPGAADAAAIFSRYASDPDVTKYLGWQRHESLAHTEAFLALSDAEWLRWPAGPYLIESGVEGRLLGSTGLAFETLEVAATGYVLARDAWGAGYATEALTAMIELAGRLDVRQLYALCHPDNGASIRVLEKCGFVLDSLLAAHAAFPNLGSGRTCDCLRYARTLGQGSEL